MSTQSGPDVSVKAEGAGGPTPLMRENAAHGIELTKWFILRETDPSLKMPQGVVDWLVSTSCKRAADAENEEDAALTGRTSGVNEFEKSEAILQAIRRLRVEAEEYNAIHDARELMRSAMAVLLKSAQGTGLNARIAVSTLGAALLDGGGQLRSLCESGNPAALSVLREAVEWPGGLKAIAAENAMSHSALKRLGWGTKSGTDLDRKWTRSKKDGGGANPKRKWSFYYWLQVVHWKKLMRGDNADVEFNGLFRPAPLEAHFPEGEKSFVMRGLALPDLSSESAVLDAWTREAKLYFDEMRDDKRGPGDWFLHHKDWARIPKKKVGERLREGFSALAQGA
jgi:hypothetical protein